MFNSIFWEMYLRNLFGRDKEPEIELFTKLICKDSFVIDVGANRGTYSFPIMRKIGADGFLFAFEPIPELFDYLGKGFSKYNNILSSDRLRLKPESIKSLIFLYYNKSR
jgi:hypothetical protein